MKYALAIVLAGGALAAVSDAPAATVPATAHAFDLDRETKTRSAHPLLLLADSDEDDDDDHDDGRWFSWNEDHDDDDDDRQACDRMKDPSCRGQGNPAPAGTVAPPNNNLFTNGTAPAVKSN